MDYPDDSFDYDDFIAKEFGEGQPHKQIGIAFYWWLTALILFLVCLFFWVR